MSGRRRGGGDFDQRWFAAPAAATVLLGAFLLFLVQPILARSILPWFGGSPSVWTTCLVFFQVVLLAGYAFAHALTRLRQARVQAALHATLAVAALACLPITPSGGWKPADGSQPTLRILVLLTVCVGLPYFVLAATGPLLQVWFSRVFPTRSPYRLYAVSNFGSLCALVAYPLLIEPLASSELQGGGWSLGFAVYAACCVLLAAQLRSCGEDQAGRAAEGSAVGADRQSGEGAAPGRAGWLAWLLLPLLATLLLMAITDHLCQEVAAVPWLWTAPLVLYLLSYILCFGRDAGYARRGWALAAILCVAAASYLELIGYLQGFWDRWGWGVAWYRLRHSVLPEISLYLGALFTACMVCHGELVRRKPAPRELTRYYLMIAAGGALGGLLVALVCPLVFSTFLERKLGMVAALLLGLLVLAQDGAWSAWWARSRPLAALSGLLAVVALGVTVWGQWNWHPEGRVLYRGRNFYGTLQVQEVGWEDPDRRGLSLFHGTTLHGFQHTAPSLRNQPTTYYSGDSGVGRALRVLQARPAIRVGVIGLGVGTLAAYGRADDYFCFYEINPLVVQVAKQRFGFLAGCPSRIEIVPGDARVALERQDPQQFDLLVLDAFSGDSVPIHLLTVEALATYLRHVKPDGMIAAHVSSRYVDLVPVLMGIAGQHGVTDVLVRRDSSGYGTTPSDWVLLARDEAVLQQPPIAEVAQLTESLQQLPLWTDRRSSLFDVLRN